MKRPSMTCALAVLAALGTLACAGSTEAPMTPATGPSGTTGGVSSSATVSAISVVPVADGGSAVVLTADRPLRWTTFRDLDGHLVVELPDTGATASAPDTSGDPLIASVDLTREADSFRGTTLTRLRIVTHEDAVHALESTGTALRLMFRPVGEAEGPWPSVPAAQASSPSAAPPSPPAPAEPLPAAPRAPGPAIAEETLDVEPVVAEPVPPPPVQPPPSAPPVDPPSAPPAVPTTRPPAAPPVDLPATGRTIRSIETRHDDEALIIDVIGDGPLPWTSFELASPARFVIDLPGVVNRAGTRLVAVEHRRVERVRLAQFESRPEPVARLVLDLFATDVEVTILRIPDGLRIRVPGPGP